MATTSSSVYEMENKLSSQTVRRLSPRLQNRTIVLWQVAHSSVGLLSEQDSIVDQIPMHSVTSVSWKMVRLGAMSLTVMQTWSSKKNESMMQPVSSITTRNRPVVHESKSILWRLSVQDHSSRSSSWSLWARPDTSPTVDEGQCKHQRG